MPNLPLAGLVGLVRLQRFLAHCGVCSRRSAEQYITDGRVTVNGEIVRTLGTRIDAQVDSVTVDGKILRPERAKLFLFYKPRHVVSTLSDPQGRPCIADFLRAMDERLYPVGRLDFDVTGLLLLTNSGELCQQLLHPSFGTERIYVARVSGTLSAESIRRLNTGVLLEDGRGSAKNVSVLDPRSRWSTLLGEPVPQTQLIQLTVQEGRKHFVKRLLRAVGHPVIRLCRVQFGPYGISGLREGEIREVQPLKHALKTVDRHS